MGTTIRISHVPEEVHRTLESGAALEGLSSSDCLLREVRAIAARPSPSELRRRLAGDEPVLTTETLAGAVRAERDSR